MSVKVSSWVWHGRETSELAGNEMIFLLALADVADDNGRCRFTDDESDLTYAALAQKARVDRRTVIRIVARLRDASLIEHVPGAKGRPNEFRVAVPWARITGDNLSPNASDSVTPLHGFGDNSSTRTSLRRKDVISGASAKRGTRMVEGWKPTPELVEEMRSKAPSVDVTVETENFVDYWLAVPGARGVKLDWAATWRTWMRRAHQRNVDRGWRPVLAAVVPDGQEWLAR